MNGRLDVRPDTLDARGPERREKRQRVSERERMRDGGT